MNKEEFLEAFNSKTRDYEMFTKQGNRKCQAITKKAIKKVFGNKRIIVDFCDRRRAAEIFGTVSNCTKVYRETLWYSLKCSPAPD